MYNYVYFFRDSSPALKQIISQDGVIFGNDKRSYLVSRMVGLNGYTLTTKKPKSPRLALKLFKQVRSSCLALNAAN
jgi:hypothetical protein